MWRFKKSLSRNLNKKEGIFVALRFNEDDSFCENNFVRIINENNYISSSMALVSKHNIDFVSNIKKKHIFQWGDIYVFRFPVDFIQLRMPGN